MGGYQLMVSADIFRGRYRESLETAKAMTADAPLGYRFALPTANHVFLPGHRIMVQVQSSWFPLYDRNPQTFVPSIFWARRRTIRKATQRIYHAPGQLSFVELPLVRTPDRQPATPPQYAKPMVRATAVSRARADRGQDGSSATRSCDHHRRVLRMTAWAGRQVTWRVVVGQLGNVHVPPFSSGRNAYGMPPRELLPGQRGVGSAVASPACGDAHHCCCRTTSSSPRVLLRQ